MMEILAHLEANQPFVLCLNAALCLAIMGISLCRLNAMDRHILLRVQVEYVFYMASGFVSIGRPWWGENVGWASLMLESGILISFLSSSHAWPVVRTSQGLIDTAPENAQSEHAPLELAP